MIATKGSRTDQTDLNSRRATAISSIFRKIRKGQQSKSKERDRKHAVPSPKQGWRFCEHSFQRKVRIFATLNLAQFCFGCGAEMLPRMGRGFSSFFLHFVLKCLSALQDGIHIQHGYCTSSSRPEFRDGIVTTM